jgi:hypothetical protein
VWSNLALCLWTFWRATLAYMLLSVLYRCPSNWWVITWRNRMQLFVCFMDKGPSTDKDIYDDFLLFGNGRHAQFLWKISTFLPQNHHLRSISRSTSLRVLYAVSQ